MDEFKQYLYRYRHLNGEHLEWTKRIITDNVLYFASPSTFNDPFDCRVHYLSLFDTDEFRRQYIKNQTPFFGRASRVNYPPTYPEISVTSSMDDQIDTFLPSKAKDWEYEREFRIIDHDHGPGEKIFPSQLLVGIIFGARMKPDNKKMVAGWASQRNNHVQLSEASVWAGSFSLEIQPYKRLL